MKKIQRTEDGRVLFQCPGCKEPHCINGFTWSISGTDEAPTFSPSVLVQGYKYDKASGKDVPYRCHSYVTGGSIQFLADCTHVLAGQLATLPEWPYGKAAADQGTERS